MMFGRPAFMGRVGCGNKLILIALMGCVLFRCTDVSVDGHPWEVGESSDASTPDVGDAADAPGVGDPCDVPTVGRELIDPAATVEESPDLYHFRRCDPTAGDVCVEGERHTCVAHPERGDWPILEPTGDDCCGMKIPDVEVTDFDVTQRVLWSEPAHPRADHCAFDGQTEARLRGNVRNVGTAATHVKCEVVLLHPVTLEEEPTPCEESWCRCLYDYDCANFYPWAVVDRRLEPGRSTSFDETVETYTVCPGEWWVQCEGHDGSDDAVVEPRSYHTYCWHWRYDREDDVWRKGEDDCTGNNVIVLPPVDPLHND